MMMSKALGFLLLGRYIPHCGLLHDKTLRQQIQRTLSTDHKYRQNSEEGDDKGQRSVPGLVCSLDNY